MGSILLQMGRKQVGKAYTSLYGYAGKVRTVGVNLGCLRGERRSFWGRLAFGWHQGAACRQQGAAREPQLGKSRRQEAGNHQRGTASFPGFAQSHPILFSQFKVTYLQDSSCRLGLVDWPLGGSWVPLPQKNVEFRPGQQLAGWKPLTQETTLASEQGLGRLVHWPSHALPPLHCSCFPGPGAHHILTNNVACKTNHCSSWRAAGLPGRAGTRENPNHKFLL